MASNGLLGKCTLARLSQPIILQLRRPNSRAEAWTDLDKSYTHPSVSFSPFSQSIFAVGNSNSRPSFVSYTVRLPTRSRRRLAGASSPQYHCWDKRCKEKKTIREFPEERMTRDDLRFVGVGVLNILGAEHAQWKKIDQVNTVQLSGRFRPISKTSPGGGPAGKPRVCEASRTAAQTCAIVLSSCSRITNETSPRLPRRS